MRKYKVLMSKKSTEDLESIFNYIISEFDDILIARKIMTMLEKSIIRLELFPYRGTTREIGKYKNKQFRQIIVKNFIIIYEIDEDNKKVIIHSIFYGSRNL